MKSLHSFVTEKITNSEMLLISMKDLFDIGPFTRKLYPAKLAPGGIIAVHNAISEAGTMREYTETIRRHPEFDTVVVSTTMDDGICLSYRHRRV